MKILNYLFILFLGVLLTSNLTYAQVGATCATPDVITSLPFSATGLSTATFGDNYSISPCSDNYIGGDDYVYEYTPTANEIVDVNLAGVATWTGLHITEGCPDVATTCVGSSVSSLAGTRSAIGLALTGGTTYYIVISTFPTPQSTAFDITVDLTPACSTAPTGGVATNVTGTTADLGWTAANVGAATSIELVTAGTTPTGVGTLTTANPEAVTGLTPATDYEFYVQEDCGGGAPATPLMISAVYDGPLTGGTPKGVELYVIDNIADLSAYGLGSANNGGGTDGEEFTFPAVAATAGSYIYVASEAVQFANYFGFAPDYTDGSMGINGDDAVELFGNGAVIDVFGDINTDGTGTAWDHLDGWAARVTGSAPGATFVVADWTFSGTDALDGCTTNAACTSVIPVGTVTSPSAASLSPWAGPFAFTTLCTEYTPYYLEDFASYIPSCWEEATVGDPTTGPSSFGSGDWQDDGWLNSGSTGAARINLFTTGSDDWLITPEFDLSVTGPWELSIDVAVTDFANAGASAMGSDDEVQLLSTTDGGATWQTVYSWNVNNNPPSETGDNFIVDLSVYTGTTQFAFWAYEGLVNDVEDYDFFVDNFEIRLATACAITELAAGVQTACDPVTVTYTQEVTVTFTDAPATGMLDVNGQLFAIGTSPQTVTLVGLVADGAALDISAGFDANPGCSLDSLGLVTAPVDCAPVCNSTQTDSGGATGDYSNNENITNTLCPDTPGDVLILTFTSVALETCCDNLGVYNGTGTAIPLDADIIAPASFASTAADGCLTLTFTSDFSVTAAGWEADVTCVAPTSCAITELAAGVQTACDPATVTYTQEVIVTFTDQPATGMLDVNGQLFAIGTSPQTVILTGLVADGLPLDISAVFDADFLCTLDSLGLITAPADCTPPPVNDLCADATMLTLQLDSCATYIIGNNTASTDSGVPAAACGGYSGGDIWFEVTVPASGNIILDRGTNDFSTVGGALYSGTCAALVEEGCADFTWPLAVSGLTPGIHYFRVWDFSNNDFGDVEVCAYDFSCTSPTVGISTDCLSDTSFQVILDFTALGSSATYTLQDDQGTAALMIPNTIGMYPYGVYANGTVVDFDLLSDNTNCDLFATAISTDCTPPPANDLCADAEMLTVQIDSCATYSLGTNAGATDSGELAPTCATYAGGDIWFEVTVPASGNVILDVGTFDFSTVGGSLYSGVCGTLVEEGCANVWPQQYAGLTPGIYYLRLWDFGNNDIGDVEICAYDFSCTLPTATVATNCLDDDNFELVLDLTVLGSSATYTVQDNQSTAPLTVSAVGMYNYGVYPNGTIVDLSILSVDNAQCDAIATGLSTDCTPPATDNCGAYTSSPAALIDDLNDPMDTITVAGTGPMVLADLNIILSIDHTFLGDLDITLTSPSGTVVNVMFDQCVGNDNINAEFDDEAATAIVCGTPTIGTFITPSGNLADFYGETFDGDWILSVVDDAGGDDGLLNQWCLVPTLATPTACLITELAAGNQRACNPTTITYTQDIVVTFTDAPATGMLDVNGQMFPIGVSPQTITLAGLTADGAPVDVAAFFTADLLCSLDSIALFTAPADCTPPPSNDLCADAAPLTIQVDSCSTFSLWSNVAATDSGELPVPSCANYAGGDIWFEVTIPASGNIILDVGTFDFSTVGGSLYSGVCGTLVEEGCANVWPQVYNGLTPGVHLLRIWDFDNNDLGDVEICAYNFSCTLPTATVATDCLTDTTFQIILDFTVLGSSATYTLQDNQATAPLTISSVGMYPYGSYANGTVVDLDLLSVDNGTCDAFASGLTTDCSPICGSTQTDSGGAAGNYSSSELRTWTLCPDNPGDILTITFTSFDVEENGAAACWDALFIYDGATTADPLIGPVYGHCYDPVSLDGTIPGGALNTPITSTDASGCLTFTFESDGTVTEPGWEFDVTCAPAPVAGVALDVKFILEGPLDLATGLMKDDLRAMGLLPLIEPYTGLAGFTHSGPGGGETVVSTVFDVTGPDAIIDWAFVELRDATTNTMVVGTRAALLQADGSLVDLDGVSPVLFDGIAAGDYYVVVRHRNHVAIMSGVAVTLGSVVNPTLDFTPGGAFGTNPQKLKGTTYVLYESDLDASGAVDAADRSDAWNNRNVSGYVQEDSNLNGVCDAAERSQAWNNRNVTTKVP